jgi:hypothetical protein
VKTALETAREKATELVANGAEAVVLVGSHARGEASPESDSDLLAIGGESYDCLLEVRNDFLVSVSMQPFAEFRRDLERPARVCSAVPGWREAKILEDPNGVAASLIEEARSWTWEFVEKKCDEWVAEEIAGNAEEVHKLAASLGSGNLSTAAVQRSLLALHLAPILAVRHRIIYGSENRMWDLVSAAMGEEWSEAQSAAFGMNGEPFEETCLAASKLYRLAADETRELLDERQRKVVAKAVATPR